MLWHVTQVGNGCPSGPIGAIRLAILKVSFLSTCEEGRVRRIRASGSSLIGILSFSLLFIGVDSLLALRLMYREGSCARSDGAGVSDFVETSGVAVADVFCRSRVGLGWALSLSVNSEPRLMGGTELLKRNGQNMDRRYISDKPRG